jgi:hypothetical protein
MLQLAVATALCGLVLLCQTTAQQFSDVPLPVNYPGISDGCFDALNTTVTCPAFLIDISIEYVPFAIYGQYTTMSNKAPLQKPSLDE